MIASEAMKKGKTTEVSSNPRRKSGWVVARRKNKSLGAAFDEPPAVELMLHSVELTASKGLTLK